MEVALPSATAASEDATVRRSGRVVRAPARWEPEPALPGSHHQHHAKRKRDAAGVDENGDDQDDDVDVEDDDEDEDEEDDDGSSDDEAHGARRRRRGAATKKKATGSRSRKPAAKKPKTNGAGPAGLAGLPSRPKKTVRIAVDAEQGGLFGSIFASGESSDDVASQWYQSYLQDAPKAITDLINCVLQSAGCEERVTEDDINDPDNASSRLADLQAVYQEQKITDYPLISKDKKNRSFRELLVGFFKALINIVHETKTLYTDEALLDNIHRWVASMTSSSLRPFRHTAVAVALALMTGLVEAARKLDVRVTKLTQQYEAEQSKAARSRNKQLLATLKQTMDEARSLNEKCRDRITDFFDTVFLHRYRDVDPRIRTDCVEALGSWVIEFPGMFRDPGYLRYLGWMLSDTNSATRNEDLRQLARIFKRDADKLGHFIDRFRGRLVEMATKDAEISVRIAAIGVIDILRVAEMLEPEDLDTVGKLIFDSEPRIRKAVVGFLTDILQAQVEEKIELLGGAEHLNEVFGEPDEDDWHAPRMEWINVKVLAENLASFESQLDGGDAASRQPQVQIAADILGTTAAETRITLAAQALYERLPEVKQWGVIAGYLLYDHSANTQTRSRKKSSSADVSVMRALVPEGREESLLLEVLTSAVKQTLAPGGEADKTKKKAKQDGVESPEETAVTLAKLIPQLLNKFGADAATATVVLRLEHFLDLDIFQRLRQDATTYSKLLDEICAQFLRHVDKSVLTEATAALLHARSYDELQELTDAKLATLWEGVLGPLRHFAESCELSVRGNLDLESLDQLVSLIVKISKLASVSNCLPTLEAEPEGGVPAIKLLISVVRRGMLEKVEAEVDDAEDELVMWAIRACNFYFMWKVVSVLERVRGPEGGIPDVEADALQALRKSYRRNLLYTLTSRAQNDAARLFSTGSLCELHAIFNSLREVIPDAASTNAASISQGQRVQNLRPLLSVMEPRVVSEITSIYTAAERRYARLTRKTLNEPAEDEDPLDLDEDENQDAFVLGPDSDPDDPNRTEEERLAVTLNAERELCELASKLILALDARAIDETGDQANKLRRRLLRNATRLGGAFREVVGFLDENRERRDKEKRQQRAVATTAGAAGKEKGKAPQPEEEEEDEFATPPPVEGSREDLEMRGLLDEEVEDDEEEAGGAPTPPSADDDDILGD